MGGKNPKNSTNSEVQKVPKLSLPGVAVNEILTLEEVIPGLRLSLAVVLIGAAIVAQLRLALPKLKASEFSQLESVRRINSAILGKSKPMLEVAAAVAVRRTISAHASDPDDTRIRADLEDLVSNPSGPSGTGDSIRACQNNPQRLRKLRRGIMLSVASGIQAAAIHHPSTFGQAVKSVTSAIIMLSLPFKSDDLNGEEVYNILGNILNLEEGYEFMDCVNVGTDTNLVPLEVGLSYSRANDQEIAALEIPSIADSAPAWRKTAVEQLKKLKNTK